MGKKTLKLRPPSALPFNSLVLLAGLFIGGNTELYMSNTVRTHHTPRTSASIRKWASVCLRAASAHAFCWPSATVCVCVHLGLVAEQNKTKQGKADLHYHPEAGRRSLSPRSVTCWSSYNYCSHTHPSQHCCGVHRAHSFSGSAALHKETITESEQAPSTRGGGGGAERGRCSATHTHTHTKDYYSIVQVVSFWSWLEVCNDNRHTASRTMKY